MRIWRLWSGGLALTLVVFISCAIGLAQVDIFWPGTQPGTYTGNAIDFGAVPVGTTKTATYTFKILETSATSATVTITRPNTPFGSDAPIGSFVLAPGQSRTFNVTFTPPSVGNYPGSFTITAKGGRPVVTKRQTVTLTGQGVSNGVPGPGITDLTQVTTAISAVTYDVATLEAKLDIAQQDTAKLETKLDTLWQAVENLRARLLKLGSVLGELITGKAINLYDWGTVLTEPVQPPQPSIVDLLAKLEAKLDRLAQRPSEATAPDINITIIEIYNIIVEINQFIINLGGNVAGLEAKLDRLAQRPSDVTIIEIYNIIVEINVTIIEIYDIIVEINQFIINLGGNVAGLEAKLDQLSADLFDLGFGLMGMRGNLNDMWADLDAMWDEMIDRFDDVEDAVAANTRAINALQASNARIEEMLNQLLTGSGMTTRPQPPDASKITAVMEKVAEGWHSVTFAGSAGAALPNMRVNIYPKPVGSRLSADVGDDGSFSVTSRYSYLFEYVEVTQIVDEQESAPVRIEVSAEQQAEAPPPPDVSKITLVVEEKPRGVSPRYTWRVEGHAEAVEPGALVTIYWEAGISSKSSGTPDGSFSARVSFNHKCRSVEVTQTIGEEESAPVRIELPVDQRGEVPPPPDASKITAVMVERIAEGSPTSYRITVAGSAGAALPNKSVYIYLEPGGYPFSRAVYADGSFSVLMANPRPVEFIEVSQVANGEVSAPVTINVERQ